MNSKVTAKNLIKAIPILLGFTIVVLLILRILTPKDLDVQLAQRCSDEQKCCPYEGRKYPIGFERGPYICRADGTWEIESDN